jgi:DNA-binding GntR family transcriptional regulator
MIGGPGMPLKGVSQATSLRNFEPKLISEHIYEALRELVIKGEIKEGERLVESDLCREFGVSRSPVRDALNMLQLDGFVELIPFKGAVVSGITEKDVREHFELKGMIEGYAASCVAEKSPRDTSDLMETLELMGQEMESDNYKGVLETNFLLHRLIVNKMENRRLSKLYESLSGYIRRFGSIGLAEKSSWPSTMEEHSRIVRLISDGKSYEAEQESRRHAKNAMERVIRWMHRMH